MFCVRGPSLLQDLKSSFSFVFQSDILDILSCTDDSIS